LTSSFCLKKKEITENIIDVILKNCKDKFVSEVSKNFVRYRSENNFAE